jgi:hypothetical protein
MQWATLSHHAVTNPYTGRKVLGFGWRQLLIFLLVIATIFVSPEASAVTEKAV